MTQLLSTMTTGSSGIIDHTFLTVVPYRVKHNSLDPTVFPPAL